MGSHLPWPVINSHTYTLSANQTSQVKSSLEEAKIIDRFSNGKKKDATHTVCLVIRDKLENWYSTVWQYQQEKRIAFHSVVNWVWFSKQCRLALFLLCYTGCYFHSLPSSSTAEAAQGHERLEAKWRPLVYPPWKPSHALSSTWGIWWKPFVSTPLNYQPEELLMLSSDNGSQQPADYSAH